MKAFVITFLVAALSAASLCAMAGEIRDTVHANGAFNQATASNA